MSQKKKLKTGSFEGSKAEAAITFPGWVVWTAFLVWGFIIFRSYLSKYSPDISLNVLLTVLSPAQYFAGAFLAAMIDHAIDLSLAIIFLGASSGFGHFLLMQVLSPGPLNSWEEASFSAALGLGISANLIIGIASLDWLSKAPLFAILLLGTILGTFSLRKRSASVRHGPVFKPDMIDYAALMLLVIAMLFALATAFGPEVFWDTLVYHLAVPNFYIIKRGFADMPYHLYSNLFMLHGMLYSAGLLLGNETVSKIINYSAGIFTVATIFGIGRRYFTTRTALWAALIFSTLAQTLYASWFSGTDLLLTLFTLSGFAAALRYHPGDKKFLLLSAFLTGCGIATKATGIFSALGIILVLVYRMRHSLSFAPRTLFLWGLIVMLPVLPWLIKNEIYRQNPFYPFLTSIFGIPSNASADKLKMFMDDTRRMGALRFKDWLIHPWAVTMNSNDNSWNFSPLFILALPLLFLLGTGPTGISALWIYFLTVWVLWSFNSTMVRFLMPAYPAAALLISAIMDTSGHRNLKKIMRITALLTCAFGLYFAAVRFYIGGEWRVICGLIPKAEFLSATRETFPLSYYPAVDHINRTLPASAKVMILGDPRSFYLKRDFIVSSIFDRTPMVEYSSAAANGDALYELLRKDGVTHIMVNAAEAMALQLGYNIFYWDKRSSAVFDDFWQNHIKEIFAWDDIQGGNRNRVAVYELVKERPSGARAPINIVRDVILKNVAAYQSQPR